MNINKLEEQPEFVAHDNSILRQLLHPETHNLPINYSLSHAKVSAFTKTLPHKLTTSEAYYILEGKGIMYIDEEKSEVGVGDAIFIPPNAVQFIENTQAEELVFLCIVEPAWKEENEEIL